jgi:hypothetical protein
VWKLTLEKNSKPQYTRYADFGILAVRKIGGPTTVDTSIAAEFQRRSATIECNSS